jgi:THO complex subunit 2
MKARIITVSQYQQLKFNLMREESEGFAKLITELMQPAINDNNYNIVKENVLTLIGYFGLDPNRTMDIILDAYEFSGCQVVYENLLLEMYPNSKNMISQSLGAKF